MIEGVDRDALTAACRDTLGDAPLRAAGAAGDIERADHQLNFIMAR